MSEALGASTSQDNGDSGSDALITYMQSHCSPEVELFSASVLTGSADKVVELSELCTKSLLSRDSPVTTSSSLMYLHHVIHNASPDVVHREYKKWISCIQQSIADTGQFSFILLKSFLNSIKKCPEANREFSTGQLPRLLQTLLSYKTTKSQATGRWIMACVSACLHYYPFLVTQHYAVLYSWATERLSSVNAAYSRESSRLLAMLSMDPTSWERIVSKLCDELTSLTTTAYAPVYSAGHQPSTSPSDSMFPPLPSNEPHRIATVTLYYQSAARSLVYLLSFRLSATPVNIPLQQLMTVVCQVFTVFPDRMAGRHALEVLLLKSALPIFYSTMFIVLEALINCAGMHLLAYSTVINQLFVHTLTWTADNHSYWALRCAVYRCISVWLATAKCYASCDQLVSMVIKDTAGLVEERPPASVATVPKKKKRKVNSAVTASSSAWNESNINEKFVTAALSAMINLLQFCGPIMTVAQLEDLEDHMIKSLSHDRHSPVIKTSLLRCIFHLINTTSHQYTPPVAWVIAIISRATCSENDQVKQTALQLINQCDLTVMSSFVPHPQPRPQPAPSSAPAHSVEQLWNNDQCDARPAGGHNDRLADSMGGQSDEDVIMIDDMSSNEGVTMETSVNIDQHVVGVDRADQSSHIDLDLDDTDDQDNDQDNDDIAIALGKFVDQSSDSSSD